jgi:hypothetical protein
MNIKADFSDGTSASVVRGIVIDYLERGTGYRNNGWPALGLVLNIIQVRFL